MLSKRIRMARRLRRAVQSQPSSGLSIRAYCQKKNIPLSTFSWWRNRIRAEVSEESISAFPAENKPAFVRIIPESTPPFSPEGCELSFPDGRILRFPAAYPVESLVAVLKGGAV